jgi:hypothetical protein
MHPAAAKALFDAEVAAVSPRLLEQRGWVLHQVEYPDIDCSFTAAGRTTLRLRVDCTNWNDDPPSITLQSADGRNLTTLPANSTNVFNSSAHPSTGRPFICMRGAREYHTHSSHLNDSWENVRHLPAFQIFNILGQVWNAWQKGAG